MRVRQCGLCAAGVLPRAAYSWRPASCAGPAGLPGPAFLAVRASRPWRPRAADPCAHRVEAGLERRHEVGHRLPRPRRRGCTAISSPAALRSISSRTSLAVLVVVLVGLERPPASDSTSCSAISSSRFVISTSATAASSSMLSAVDDLVGEEHGRHARASPSIGRSATRYSFERMTTRAIADLVGLAPSPRAAAGRAWPRRSRAPGSTGGRRRSGRSPSARRSPRSRWSWSSWAPACRARRAR